MDFHELEAFLALSDSLHFARAADTMHLSPSALSRLIARLEEETGARLVSRDARRVSLTADGEHFRDFARESLHRKEDLALRLSSTDTRLRGIVRVYASVTACYSILPPFVAALSATHPELRLSVETGDPASASDAIREGRAELAVSAIPPGGFADLESHSVRKTPLVFASSGAGAFGSLDLARAPFPGSAHLERAISGLPVILPRSGLARQRFDLWIKNRFDRVGLERPQIAAETAGNEALLALARLGLGLALVPRLVLDNTPFADGLTIYSTGPDFGDYDIGIVHRRIEDVPVRSRALLAALSDTISANFR